MMIINVSKLMIQLHCLPGLNQILKLQREFVYKLVLLITAHLKPVVFRCLYKRIKLKLKITIMLQRHNIQQFSYRKILNLSLKISRFLSVKFLGLLTTLFNLKIHNINVHYIYLQQLHKNKKFSSPF